MPLSATAPAPAHAPIRSSSPLEPASNEDVDTEEDSVLSDSDATSENSSQDSTEENSAPDSPYTRRTGRWLHEPDIVARILRVLEKMKLEHVDLPILLWAILYNYEELDQNSSVVFERTSLLCSKELPEILGRIYERPNRHGVPQDSRSAAHCAVKTLALSIMKKEIDADIAKLTPEMELPPEKYSAKAILSTSAKDLEAKSKTLAPTIWKLFRHAACTELQKRRNKKKKTDAVRLTLSNLAAFSSTSGVNLQVVFYMISMALFSRSPHLSRMHKLLTTYLRSCNLPAKAYDTLHHFGITLSQKWAYSAVKTLAVQATKAMKQDLKKHVWFVGHDNVNIPFKVQEQRLHNQSHFDSGTASTIYVIRDPTVVQPNNRALHQRRLAGVVQPITFSDIVKLECNARARLKSLFVWRILSILLESPEFDRKKYVHQGHPSLQRPKPWRQLSTVKSEGLVQYMLPTVHQEEASYEGNDRVLEHHQRATGIDTISEQRRTGLNRVILLVGDQLTSSRVRGVKQLRRHESNSYERLEWLIPTFGFFHLIMNLGVSLHKSHYGKTTGHGLAHAFTHLRRKGLHTTSTAGPFHHALEEGMYHVATARFRDLWCLATKVKSLSELRKKRPHELLNFAEQIYNHYASTRAAISIENQPKSKRDDVLRDIIIFNRDILEYMELDESVRRGDTGTMEDMLPRLLFRFAGGNSSNYTIEILELLQGLHREWPDDVK
jgi:hypothetical protein